MYIFGYVYVVLCFYFFIFKNGVNWCILNLMPYNWSWGGKRYRILWWIKRIVRRNNELWRKKFVMVDVHYNDFS